MWLYFRLAKALLGKLVASKFKRQVDLDHRWTVETGCHLIRGGGRAAGREPGGIKTTRPNHEHSARHARPRPGTARLGSCEVVGNGAG